MKITFDSNVWQPLVTPEATILDREPALFTQLRDAIVAGKITPFISETIFTLEGINKKDRQGFLEEYEPKFTSTSTATETTVSGKVSIGPDEDAHPGNNQHLKKHLINAVALGFKIIRYPRIGGIINKDIMAFTADVEGSYSDFLEYAAQIAHRIEELGSGRKPLHNILSKYPRNQSLRKWIAKVPASEATSIAKAVAEAADADSVTAHIAMGHDYFCTRDKAKSSGQKSIFGANNITVLEREFGFRCVTPAELATLVHSNN